MPPGQWGFDGNWLKPTLVHSLRTTWQRGELPVLCHVLVRAGMLTFGTDCNHALAGRTVPMEPF